MNTVQVDLPEELLRSARLDTASTSQEVAKLIALELYREGTLSLGKAAELSGASVDEFLLFSGRRDVPLHYTLDDLVDDRRLIDTLDV